MMFQDVVLTWKGADYTVKAVDVMRLISIVESKIRLPELIDEQGPPLSKLAMAYGEALRFAGCKVTNEEIYSLFFVSGESAEVRAAVITGLMMMMVPPANVLEKLESEAKKKAMESQQ